jgi:hypothetical protein
MSTELNPLQKFLQKKAYLLLGLSRSEFLRRCESGQIDLQVLEVQLEQHSREVKLEALCEKWLESQEAEQVDKFADLD